MSNKNLVVDAALEYLGRGWSIIPVTANGKDKKPLIQWKEYQSRLPTEKEVREWYAKFPDAGVGIITGSISKLVVVDVEADGSVDGLTPTVIAKTGGKGWHFYYKHPGVEIKNSVEKIAKRVDVRGDGGFVVAPPTLNTGYNNPYEWSVTPQDSTVGDLPEWVKEEIVPVMDLARVSAKAVSEGGRNNNAVKIIGKLIKSCPPADWEEFCWPLVSSWNTGNTPPLERDELRKAFDSISIAEANKLTSPLKQVDSGGGQVLGNLKHTLWSDFACEPESILQWRVGGLIPAEGLGILASPAGEKKTWFALEMARCIASGVPFLGHFPVTQGRVMYIEQEMPERELRRRGKKLGLDKNATNVWLTKLSGTHMNSSETAEEIIRTVREKKIDMIFVDTLRAVAGGMKEEDAIEVRKFFNLYSPLKDMGVFMLLLDHTRKLSNFDGFEPKLDQIFGSQDKKGCVESILMLRSPEGSPCISVYHKRCRIAKEHEPFKVSIDDVPGEDGNTNVVLAFAGAPDHSMTKKSEACNIILSLLHDTPRARSEILALLSSKSIGGRNTSEALRTLKKEGLIIVTKHGRENTYSLPSVIKIDTG